MRKASVLKKYFKSFILLMTSLAMFFFFQNCGNNIHPLDSLSQSQGLIDAAAISDQTYLSSLLSVEKTAFWQRQTSVLVQKNSMFTTESSVALVVSANEPGRVFSFNSGENAEDSYLEFSAGNVRAIHKIDNDNYSYLQAPLPTGNDKIIVAASFGKKWNEIHLQINGIVQHGVIVKVGHPADFSYLLKSVSLPVTFSASGEVIVYLNTLKNIELNVISRHLAEASNINGVAFDPSLIVSHDNEEEYVPPTAAFLAAKVIIDTKCLRCHNKSDNGDYRNFTENKYIQRNLIVPGDPNNSKLIYRLRGAVYGVGPKDMPADGDALSADEIQILTYWIQNI